MLVHWVVGQVTAELALDAVCLRVGNLGQNLRLRAVVGIDEQTAGAGHRLKHPDEEVVDALEDRLVPVPEVVIDRSCALEWSLHQ